MVFPNDSLISDEIPYKSEENILNERSRDQKPDEALIDADPLLCNDIFNKFEETISEEPKLGVIPNIICLYNAFVPCEILVQCEAQVQNDLDFDYNSDDFISTAVYVYRKNTSNVYSKQCEKYVLNEVTSFINWEYKIQHYFVEEDSLKACGSNSRYQRFQYTTDMLITQSQESGESVPILVVNSNNNECILDNRDFTQYNFGQTQNEL
ncbi:unnamed protein product [Schistosoma margrebowiei]|uniref:Uncharacterized protein n=1 Tax=Schistosoma margrebowiei TaxID=48269 RepID=A0A183ML91_9TREM|nr:unnamed protein product [Schistosoma margrebowiei]